MGEQRERVNHLEENENQIDSLIQSVYMFNKDIRIELGLSDG